MGALNTDSDSVKPAAPYLVVEVGGQVGRRRVDRVVLAPPLRVGQHIEGEVQGFEARLDLLLFLLRPGAYTRPLSDLNVSTVCGLYMCPSYISSLTINPTVDPPFRPPEGAQFCGLCSLWSVC